MDYQSEIAARLRPKLLMQAVRHALTMPVCPREAAAQGMDVQKLLQTEAAMEATRRKGAQSYSGAAHVAVWVRLIQALPPQAAQALPQ